MSEQGAPAGGQPAPVAVGSVAPGFALTDQRLKVRTLEEFRGKKLLVVFFPLVFTSVCGGELTRLRDEIADFSGDDRALVAISTDTSATHRAFDDREFVGYPLLSDFWPHGKAAQAYGVFDDRSGLARRGTFLVDEQGVVRWSVSSGMPDARSTDEYRAALGALSGAS